MEGLLKCPSLKECQQIKVYNSSRLILYKYPLLGFSGSSSILFCFQTTTNAPPPWLPLQHHWHLRRLKSTSRQSGLPGLSSEAQKGTGQGLFKGGQMMNWTNPNEQNLKTNSWNLKKSFKIEKDNFIWSNNSITLGSILIFQYQNLMSLTHFSQTYYFNIWVTFPPYMTFQIQEAFPQMAWQCHTIFGSLRAYPQIQLLHGFARAMRSVYK